ncbi:hypothetical protein B0T20DRAFT_391228 [Sordaria brevicollis]|uniref:Uncharacterized protein n=1 Tax=Sordaria brevicollis TaxID=83679 RepID=A0AAE0PGP1_SORBR|nr:hypothetical protein B0T20DRAFT_391228 [Sordaria brevicollis]
MCSGELRNKSSIELGLRVCTPSRLYGTDGKKRCSYVMDGIRRSPTQSAGHRRHALASNPEGFPRLSYRREVLGIRSRTPAHSCHITRGVGAGASCPAQPILKSRARPAPVHGHEGSFKWLPLVDCERVVVAGSEAGQRSRRIVRESIVIEAIVMRSATALTAAITADQSGIVGWLTLVGCPTGEQCAMPLEPAQTAAVSFALRSKTGGGNGRLCRNEKCRWKLASRMLTSKMLTSRMLTSKMLTSKMLTSRMLAQRRQWGSGRQ